MVADAPISPPALATSKRTLDTPGMRLGHVGIRNYRGIRSLDLPIDRVTTLIGENAYGKSNLLDALLACLGPGAGDGQFAFQIEDFGDATGDPDPPIEIELGFRESDEGEWDDACCDAIRPHIYRGRLGDRRLSYRIVTSASADGAITTATQFVDRNGQPIGPPSGPEATHLLRQRCPFLLLKADRYFTRPSRAPAPGTRPLSLEARLAAEIGEAYQALVSPHEAMEESTLHGGLSAARAYIDRFGGERLRDRIRHFLPAPPHSERGTGVSLAVRSMALMLVLGALLEARAVQTFGEHSYPILAIEDAEAHLHPIMLASVAALIQAIPAQKLITTNSGELLSMLPLRSIRRLLRAEGRTLAHRLERETLGEGELRRVSYHVKANRGTSLFARAWLLVEGETEFWLLPQMAELLGHDLALEGIRIMEFAQCGVEPLIKMADDLGIGWHLLADGDSAGRGYALIAGGLLRGRPAERHITELSERDLEHCLWNSGYAEVFRDAVSVTMPRRAERRPKIANPTPTIERAIRARTKPGMAVEVAEAARTRGADGVPQPLRLAIEAVTSIARRCAGGAASETVPRTP